MLSAMWKDFFDRNHLKLYKKPVYKCWKYTPFLVQHGKPQMACQIMLEIHVSKQSQYLVALFLDATDEVP